MVEPVLLPVFCVEIFTGQNTALERYYPDKHLPLKFCS